MTRGVRRLTLVAALIVAFCAIPKASSAEECYFDYGIYAELDYVNVSEDLIDLWSLGAGIDYSSCGECGHAYAMYVDIERLYVANLYSDYQPNQTEFNVPAFGVSLTTTVEDFRTTF